MVRPHASSTPIVGSREHAWNFGRCLHLEGVAASAPQNPAGFAIRHSTNLSHWLAKDFGWTPWAIFITENDLRFIVREVHALERALPSLVKKITWVLRPGPSAHSFFHELRIALDRQSGDTLMEIGLLGEDDFVAVAEVSGALKWRIDPSEFKKLRRHPACAGFVAETKPIPAAEPRRWGKKNGGGG